MDIRERLISVGLLGLTVLVTVGLSLSMTLAALPPRVGVPVMVVTAPWSTAAEEIVRHAGGVPISPWQPRRIAALASFEGDIPLQELHRLGVWAVLDGQRVAEICGGP